MKNKKPLRLVIADDSVVVRAGLRSLLGALNGIEVLAEASDGPSAIAAIAEHKPDVAILDISMPGKTGIEVLRHVKREWPATVVIMFTNYASPHYRAKCRAAGADYFFDKSLEMDGLCAVLETLLAYFAAHTDRSQGGKKESQ
jgi:DNA-binding NarL/FixJ family response regulator